MAKRSATAVWTTDLQSPERTRAADGAGQWIEVFPAGPIATRDGRRYVNDRAGAIVAAFQADRVDLPVDWEHASETIAAEGQPAPAAGWVRELEVRDGALWARVEWTDRAKAMIEAREYRYFSPAFHVAKASKRITRLTSIALTNHPAMHVAALARQSATTTEETGTMDPQLLEALGLDNDADEAAVLAAVKARATQLAALARALGLDDSADHEAVLAAVRQLEAETDETAKGDGETEAVVAGLQKELATVTEQLVGLRAAAAREKATAFVDGEIARGRVGVKPLRDHYIARHMKDPEAVETELAALPLLTPSGTAVAPPPAKDGEVSLSHEQLQVARMLGQDPKTYAETLRLERAAEQEAL